MNVLPFLIFLFSSFIETTSFDSSGVVSSRQRQRSRCSLCARLEAPGRAIVVGGSIAGLLSASVLAKHFEEVLVLDRDDLTQELPPVPRLGVPQSSMAHSIFVRGFDIVKELLPGIENTLADAGALDMDWTHQYKVYRHRHGFAASTSPEAAVRFLGRELKSISCSRFLLETTIRKALRSSHTNVQFEAGRVVRLLVRGRCALEVFFLRRIV